MIITDRLVFIHLAKTGGTFVSRMIAEAHFGRLAPLARVEIVRKAAGRLGVGFHDVNKHGPCSQIPEKHRDKPIVGCIRSPYERYVSRYEFGWWRQHPREWWDWESIRARYPRFPEVSFPEFVDISSSMFHRLPANGPPEGRLGCYTEEFVRYYFREPDRVFPQIDEIYLTAEAWSHDMFPVRFLRTENLNRDLHATLVECGYPTAQVEFILEGDKVRPPGGNPTRRPWQSYYTPELAALVRHRERFLFQLFPEYDI